MSIVKRLWEDAAMATLYSLTLRVRLNPMPADEQALAIAKTWAKPGTLVLTSTAHDDRTLAVTIAVEAGDSYDVLQSAVERFRGELRQAGYSVEQWEAIELRSPAETQRLMDATAIPPMVSAVEFAELCSVTRQRIYELESDRKAKDRAGERSSFPRPVVDGYWLRTAAEHFAATRKTKPGPAKAGATAINNQTST